MVMTARERILACLNEEEPDKIPVCAWDYLRLGPQGGWKRRLSARGMGIIRHVPLHKPAFRVRYIDPHLEDVKYIQIHYVEKGLLKYRHAFETPVGTITGVIRKNPMEVDLVADSQEEYFVKERSDWRVVNYIFKGMLAKLAPDYDYFERVDDELGDTGFTFGVVGKTPFQRAWVELATLERTLIDFEEQPEELKEYVEIQRKLHTRIAEIVAASPAKFIDITDHVTDITPPVYYREYCMPFYEIYSKALKGTDKVLGSHMDGRFGHLKKEVAEAPFKVVESLTVPPVGDISLTEAKSIWPDKILFVNTPPHLALADREEVRKGYVALAEEWGSKKGLLIEHSEEMPLEKVEAHLSAALDVFGY
jgi:hypothetical protein